MRWLWLSLGTWTLVTGIVGAFSCMSWWRLPSWLTIAKTWTHPTVCRMPQAKQLTEQRHSLTHQQKLLKDFLSSQSPPDKALNIDFLTRGPRVESGPFALGSSHEPLDHPTHQEGRHQKQKTIPQPAYWVQQQQVRPSPGTSWALALPTSRPTTFGTPRPHIQLCQEPASNTNHLKWALGSLSPKTRL